MKKIFGWRLSSRKLSIKKAIGAENCYHLQRVREDKVYTWWVTTARGHQLLQCNICDKIWELCLSPQSRDPQYRYLNHKKCGCFGASILFYISQTTIELEWRICNFSAAFFWLFELEVSAQCKNNYSLYREDKFVTAGKWRRRIKLNIYFPDSVS